MTPTRVLITGAAGIVGTVVLRGLAGNYELVAVDRRRTPGISRANLSRLRPSSRLFDGVDAVVDLAAEADLAIPWQRARQNMRITTNVLEAARAHGVRRYVYASTNHVVGLYERDEPYASIVSGRLDGLTPDSVEHLTPSSPPRPDSPYAIAKLFGEAAARYCAETSDLSVIVLRIGTVMRDDRPSRPRHFATLLSHRDLCQIVDRSLGAPDAVRFGIYYGVSANTWRFWAIENAVAELGYAPQDDAEAFR